MSKSSLNKGDGGTWGATPEALELQGIKEGAALSLVKGAIKKYGSDEQHSWVC
ncbi:MAG: hypothetical protein MI742_15255 [Desulfobacterales bacterium]|nr:hypothetical protein [Desulfobacterales bacterium]